MSSTESRLKVTLGTISDQKLQILEEVLNKYHLQPEITPVKVDSGITDQPLDLDTTVAGAVNRCRGALIKVPGTRLGVGLEGGLTKSYDNTQLTLVCVAALAIPNGELAVGISDGTPLPPEVSQAIISGQKFGAVIRAYAKKVSRTEQKHWHVDDLIDRKRCFTQAINTALIYLYSQYLPQTPPGLPPVLK